MLDTQKDNVQKHDREKFCVMKKKTNMFWQEERERRILLMWGGGANPVEEHQVINGNLTRTRETNEVINEEGKTT